MTPANFERVLKAEIEKALKLTRSEDRRRNAMKDRSSYFAFYLPFIPRPWRRHENRS